MERFGEVIHGHSGQYNTLQYGDISEITIDKYILNHTEAGEQDSCNQMLFIGTPELPSYVWSTFAAKSDSGKSIAGYQHAVYQDCSLENIHDITEIVNFPFLNAEDCAEYLKGNKEFCSETRRDEIENFISIESLPEIEIDGDLLARLAGYCVSKTDTKAKGFLRILVPEDEKNYQGYCRSAVIRLLNVIPVGLRKNISIATNPSRANEQFFGILFQRDRGGKVPCSVRLDGSFDDDFLSENNYLDDNINKLIGLCAENPEVVEDCFSNMERMEEERSQLTKGCYSDFYEYYFQSGADINMEFLRQMSAGLQQGRQSITNVIRNRISGMDLFEEVFRQEVLQEHRDIPFVLEALHSCRELIKYFQREGSSFTADFAESVLDLESVEEAEIEENYRNLKEYKEELAQYFDRQYIEELIWKFDKKKKDCLQKRLVEEILNNPKKETVEKVFYEAERDGAEFVSQFGQELCVRVREAAKGEALKLQDAYALYLPIRSHVSEMDEKYTELFCSFFVKGFCQKTENNFSAEILKSGCEEIRQTIPGGQDNFVKILFQTLQNKIKREFYLPDKIKEMLDILESYALSKELKKKIDECRQDVCVEDLKKKISENPQVDDINMLLSLAERYGFKKEEEIVKDIYMTLGLKLADWRKYENGQGEFEAFCDSMLKIRSILKEWAIDRDLELYKEAESFNNDFRKCFVEYLSVYLSNAFSLETLTLALDYADKVVGCRDLCGEICRIVIKQLEGEPDLEDKEAEQIFELFNRYGIWSEDLDKWNDYWQKRISNVSTYNGIIQKTRSFAQYFFYCRARKDVLDTIPRAKEKLLDNLIGKIKPSKRGFDSFLSGMFSAEREDPFTLMSGGNPAYEEKLVLYIDTFYNLYERKNIGIRLDRRKGVFEIYTQVYLYRKFLELCTRDKIYFWNRKGKELGDINKDIIDDIFDYIKKVKDGGEQNEEETALGQEGSEGLRLLQPHCRQADEMGHGKGFYLWRE